MAQITRFDEPKLSKYGNPTLRFTLSWGLVCYNDDGTRLEMGDLIEDSDGNILTLTPENNFVWSRAKGIWGYSLNRPSHALQEMVMETLTSEGYTDILMKYAKKLRKKAKIIDLPLE